MKLKVKILDKKLLKNYFATLSIINVIFSFAFIFIKIQDNYRLLIGISLILFFIIIYLFMWLSANFQTRTTLNVNNSTLVIKIGDIFEEEGLKVITFNEYFDTQVDDKIIANNSLNGLYINSKVDDIKELDNRIDSDDHLNEMLLDPNENRSLGKKKRYRLGTIFKNENYLLTAFTKFDDKNRAHLYMKEYVSFLLNLWNEIDIIYAGKSVSIPLMGSGLTRFKEYSTISEQELLELLIWSFKVSRIKFTYPSRVSIIIHETKRDKINFYNLK